VQRLVAMTPRPTIQRTREAPGLDDEPRGLDDPRAVDILTTEHWSLLSTRTLGYQEMFSRATIFIAVLSGTVVALALLAQATDFGRESLWLAVMFMAVALFVGFVTFVRSVAINAEDARWVAGMNRLRHAYLQMVPGLEPYFVTSHDPEAGSESLAHGGPQRLRNLANSLTTTSGVVAALNSVLVGSIVGALSALFGFRSALIGGLGGAASIVSAILHVRYAARHRRRHDPSSFPLSS
jgi:hypothetical protein